MKDVVAAAAVLAVGFAAVDASMQDSVLIDR